MGYLHINNLYKDHRIFLFKECYAMEKIHGTSAHISYKGDQLTFFSGGANYEDFIQLFDHSQLLEQFRSRVTPDCSVTVYGEAYGGKLQGMRDTYGPKLKFIVFDVMINNQWLPVPKAERVANYYNLEFVHYKLIKTTLEAIDAERDAPSVQAVRNGIVGDKMREGIVLRPLEEFFTREGRVIVKHKRDEFRETATPRKVKDNSKLAVLEDARKIAEEWVTFNRLHHIIGRGEIELRLENIGAIIPFMIEDIFREAKGEIIESPDVRKAIGYRTALLIKEAIKQSQRNHAD